MNQTTVVCVWDDEGILDKPLLFDVFITGIFVCFSESRQVGEHVSCMRSHFIPGTTLGCATSMAFLDCRYQIALMFTWKSGYLSRVFGA